MDKRYSKDKQTYLKLCQKFLPYQIGRLKKQINQIISIQKSQSLFRIKQMRKIWQMKQELLRLQEAFEKFRVHLSSEFEKLVRIPEINSLEIEGSLIRIYTRELWLKTRKNRKKIGCFCFEIDLEGTIRIKNLSPEVNFVHPLIRNERPILGEQTIEVMKLLANYQIAKVVVILLKFLRRRN